MWVATFSFCFLIYFGHERKLDQTWNDLSAIQSGPLLNQYTIKFKDGHRTEYEYLSNGGVYWYNRRGISPPVDIELKLLTFPRRLRLENKTELKEERIDEDYFK